MRLRESNALCTAWVENICTTGLLPGGDDIRSGRVDLHCETLAPVVRGYGVRSRMTAVRLPAAARLK